MPKQKLTKQSNTIDQQRLVDISMFFFTKYLLQKQTSTNSSHLLVPTQKIKSLKISFSEEHRAPDQQLLKVLEARSSFSNALRDQAGTGEKQSNGLAGYFLGIS